MISAEPRITVVVLTHDRRDEVLRTVGGLSALPDRIRLCVVDNGSCDGTVDALRAAFPDLHVIETGDNLGAAGRNLGVRWTRTPYVAFCDDDTCWQPHSLDLAADILDRHPDVAVLCAQVQVGTEGRPDPACERMARSPLPSRGLPGKALLGFLAGAAVMRACAFVEAGGYHPAFFIGAEEALMALDFAAAGWRMVYCPRIVTRHHPSPRRDTPLRRRLLARNEIWTAWLRLPVAEAGRETLRILRELRGLDRLAVAGSALGGLPWIPGQRRVVPPRVLAMRRALARGMKAGGGPVPLPGRRSAPSSRER
ncbi:glycosyltransferase [Pigmentiphaga sp. YJ18]|uniref:glycosyltransferase family 2 protein n=1 Tax=Pigmentiphaga sp. YJ18 TaxID=3134907 RepID=UPI00310FA980